MEEQQKKKILMICVTSQNVVTFRSGLIKRFQDGGYNVSAIAFDDEYRNEIVALGVDFYCVSDANRSLNPLKLLSLKKRYRRLIKNIAPDVVFTFMLKPNIFGTRAAKAAGVKKVFSMVEGAGDAFIQNTLKWKAIRFVLCKLYKKSFKIPQKIFFLNEDDKKEFIERKLVKSEQCEIVRGIGVDLEKFERKPIQNERTFLMIARMLKTKGVLEYCKAARIVKQKYPDAVFNYLGAEGSLKLSDLQEYIDDGSITYLGTTHDVRPYIENCVLLLLLSSYREGMPMSVMEAEAMGRGVIVSDGVGCKDTVMDGYNGFILPVGDYEKMAGCVIWCIENPEKTRMFGEHARAFAEEHFDSKKINEKIFEAVEE